MGYRGIAHMGHGAHGPWEHMGNVDRRKWGTGCVGHMASKAHRGKWVQGESGT